MERIRIEDDFWNRYTELVRNTVIPYQWEALNDRIQDAEPSRAIRNFRIAAGLEEGEFGGMVFQDSDLTKWLEAVGYSLGHHPDPALERTADEAIELIAQAQRDNGYMNTYFAIKEPGKEWTNLHDCHELYCAGHLIEAAVAYFRGTGKRKLLDIACKFADHIDSVFGPEEGKLQGYCGHQEIELALVKLYQATGESRYLQLSQYFIDQRGQEPNYFHLEWERRGRTSHWVQGITAKPDLAYNQSHLPVREQSVAVGHSVRAVYMYTAMADLARLTGDRELVEASRRLWSNMTGRQMYITGGIGSTHHGEAFSFDYDLPNDTVYAETCASIGLIFFAQRMLQLEPKSEYADVLERALYNNVLGSMALDGKHFFYVNPLEVWPEASAKNPGRRHVKAVRQKWFGCSCCPPNAARLLSSLNDYIYTVDKPANTVYAHLFIGSSAALTTDAGEVTLKQRAELPWSGKVTFEIDSAPDTPVTLALRIPEWSRGEAVMIINGAPEQYTVKDGYALAARVWKQGDRVEWNLAMDIQLLEANPQIRANAGKAAIQRGPLVYCLEEIDNGSPVSAISIAADSRLTAVREEQFPGGAIVIEGEGYAEDASSWADQPYRPLVRHTQSLRWKAVPYYLWGNRGQGEMSVWVRYGIDCRK